MASAIPNGWYPVGGLLNNLIPHDGTRYFVLYTLDRLGLEDHGGSTPGMLTLLGTDVLAALNEHGTIPDEW